MASCEQFLPKRISNYGAHRSRPPPYGWRRSGGLPARDRGEDVPGQLELIGRLGLRDHVALDEVAAQPAQQAEAFVILDALGDDPQAQRVGELDGRGDQGQIAALLGLGEAADEAAIEL